MLGASGLGEAYVKILVDARLSLALEWTALPRRFCSNRVVSVYVTFGDSNEVNRWLLAELYPEYTS